ncbi:fucose-binding lectin II [Kitasatospora sp. NPDC048365]|uniref:fucose-binding lectin II n=1 Tax=Kitasatospora sp. NPDC048365 TaxID=3364050 RepID=UPI00372048A3
MDDKASVSISGNNAAIHLPAGLTAQVKVKTNAKSTQKVALMDRSGEVDLVFSGTGEGNTVIGEKIITPGERFLLDAVFEYAGTDGVLKPSKLNSGGPFEVGSLNLLVVVAENGDDTDYNDTILEFSWYTR